MSSGVIFSFLGVCMLAYVVPGADWLLIAKASIRSRHDGLVAALGVQTGLVVHGLFALVGLSAILAASPAALTVVQVLGALYIVGLGIRGAMTARTATGLDVQGSETRSTLRLYRDCAIANILNPKAILFFVSVLPQFLDRDLGLAGQIVLLTVLDVLLGLVWWAALVLLIRRMVDALRSDAAAQRLNLVSSIALVLVGVGLLVYTGIDHL